VITAKERLVAGKAIEETSVNLDPSSSPLAFFAAELKRLRANACMTQESLAEAAGYAPSTVAAIETCRLLPSDQFAERCDKVLRTDGHLARFQELVDRTSVLPWFRDLVKVERTATEIRIYEPYQVPPLLQTEEYMRALARADRPMLSDADIDQAVALRTTRQKILDHDEMPPVNQEITPRLWVIMDEPVLYRAVGGPQIMRAQHEHLIAMAKRPNVTIQIIANAQGATCAHGRAFEIFVSKSESLIYIEDIGSARYVRQTDEAGRYLLAFDYLRASALDEEGSLKLMKDAAR
jgi:transcriptional regulator with XRE-family HTH domain